MRARIVALVLCLLLGIAGCVWCLLTLWSVLRGGKPLLQQMLASANFVSVSPNPVASTPGSVEPVIQEDFSNVSIPEEIVGLATGKVEIPVRPMVALSGASKKEVFALRKQAVAASPFARAGYQPSDAVFGEIVSGKPWIAADLCFEPGTRRTSTKGPSEETRFINNPTALIAIEYPVMLRGDGAPWCTRPDTNVVMQKIEYDAAQKEITVAYLHLPFRTRENGTFYDFNGVNARDLGYPYMYVDLSKSTYRPDFLNADNASTQVVKLQNFLHLGGSCGVSSGCNNGSPRQPALEFHNDLSTPYKTRTIYVKLWKKKPTSPSAPADMTEKILIYPARNSKKRTR